MATRIRSTFSTMLAVVEQGIGSRATVQHFMCIRDGNDGMSETNDIENALALIVARVC